MKSMVDLGFGGLRFPLKNDEDVTSWDYEKTCTCFDEFLAKGFKYFDTAFTYFKTQGEEMVRKALVERYPRESYELATKMPLVLVKKEEDLEQYFDKQLENCGVDFFDYYLLHNVCHAVWQTCEKTKVFDFVKKKKDEGKILHIGFSFHDDAEFLDEVLNKYGEYVEFVQLQINYADWESPVVQSRKCLEIARKYGKPVTVMEPCKGGTLSNLPEAAEKLLKEYAPDASIASWSMRFVASQEGITRILSGMNEIEQVIDNANTFLNFIPLSNEEYEILKKVTEIIISNTAVPCTGCAYCVTGCPKKILIPKYFAIYNNFKRNTGGKLNSTYVYYDHMLKDHTGPADCIQCGQCENKCPQHLPIRKHLADIKVAFDNRFK